MLRKRHLVFAAIGLLVLGGIAAGAPRGNPELSLFLPDNRVDPGDNVDLEVYVLNGGSISLGSEESNDEDRVTTARRVRLLMSAGRAPIAVQTAERPVGNVPEGVTGPVTFSIAVDEDAKPGRYQIPIRLKYKYTHQIADGSGDSTIHQEKTATTTEHVTLRVERSPRFEIVDADLGTIVDGTGNVTVTIRNAGSAVAREARLTITSEDDRLRFDGTPSAMTFTGRWPRGENRTFTFESSVPDDASNRSFPVTIDVTYEDTDGVTQQSETRRTGIAMAGRKDRFVIVDTMPDLPVGGSGLVVLTIRNAGNDAVQEARVSMWSNDPKLRFGGVDSAETFIGPWPAGETRDVAVKANLAADGDIRPYSVAASVSYREADGERRETNPLTTGIIPRPEQTFAVRGLKSTLAVGSEGTVTGTVVNTGDRPVENAVVLFETTNPNVNPVETEFQVGTIDPNEGVPFAFDVEISDTAAAGPRQFTVRVRYRDVENDIRRSDPLDVNVSVGPEQDTFAVEPVNGTVAAGQTRRISVRVTNIDDEPLADISAKIFTSAPLSASDDEAFISELAPGESGTILFELTADASALSKTYPTDIDFQYEEADGDTVLSQTYKLPIRVRSPQTGNAIPIHVIAAVVAIVVLGIGGIYWYRRR